MKGKHTELIHRGERRPLGGAAPLTTPIYETSTFVFESARDVERYQDGSLSAYLYSRYDNPTVVAAEEKLASIDAAEASLLFSSGMAATSTALLTLLQSGDEIVCGAASYGGTFHLIEHMLPRFGVERRFASLEELGNPASILGPRTRVLWFETPINPTLRCVDIRVIADACRAAGVVTCIDNTFASPVNQRPLELGIDLSMQSVTKYLNGHSDVTGGVLSGSRARLAPISKARRLLGGVMDPQPAYALSRGLKTLPLRVARHNANALAVAEFLAGHPAVDRVYYPGLTSHPDHAIAVRQMTGFGGMVCIDVKGGQRAAYRAFDRFEVIQRAASLGGVESLCSLPILTSQYGMNDKELEAAGVSRGMMRLSIGLEDHADLIDDLNQALGA
ncbi:MAG TPA: aminotransferase class I/II-fold pyridoxal phosphate-dependent enzyme [Vicinamibacterales bacterium]|nr:aminotransferase class I/II-fold pyridoxal phosphate-dependent enzyme [Vicinamibacterales bacterium]